MTAATSPTSLTRTSTRSLRERELQLLKLKRKQQVRQSLEEWSIEALRPFGFRPARHHQLLIRHLEALERGEVRRLMVLMPPGSAKSTYASLMFPAWWLARHPRSKIIAASHTAGLASSFGRSLRNMVQEHGDLLGYTVDPHRMAADDWATTDKSEYFALGVGGPIAGHRADLSIIDDPLKNREEADSETIRNSHWSWWKNDMFPRLKPGARVLLIMTRWHEDDLGGRLLDDAKHGGEEWSVLSLPMEARENDPLGRRPGEPLWSEWFTQDMRDQARRDPRVWSALYQQEPAPDDGTYFLREYLRPVDSLPSRAMLRVYGASDYAVTADGGDYTVHVVIGVDHQSNLYLLDLWRGQTGPEVWIEKFCDMVIRWKPLGWAEETGQIRAGVGPFLHKRALERQAYVARTAFPTRGDKAVRAQAIRGRMAMMGLHYSAHASWRSDFEAELLAFPAGKHDDQVDALGLVGQLLDRIVNGPEPPPPPEEIRGTQQMTLAEAFRLAQPTRPDRRI